MQRWGGYLSRRLEEDLEPEPLPAINWAPEGGLSRSTYTVALYSAQPLKADASSRSLLRVAAALQDCCSVLIVTQETYSRCRIYSLCREFGIEVKSFGVRQVGNLDSEACHALVSFGQGPDHGLSVPQFAFERDGSHLLALIDSLDDRTQ